HLPIAFEDLGEFEVKNDLRPLRVYRIVREGWAAPPGRSRERGAPPERSALGVRLWSRAACARRAAGPDQLPAATGQHLWADRFDSTLDDSFDLQDRFTESVIGSVGRVARGRDRTRPAQARDGTRRL